MNPVNRREFVGDVSRGMLIAGLGTAAAAELGLESAWAGEEKPIRFGADEALVALLQETTPDKILSAVVQKLKSGTTLKQITAASALANARAFGGEDYIGYHTLMALGPALEMSRELQGDDAALPVLKVVYRNSTNLHNTGGCKHSSLHMIDPAGLPAAASDPTAIREATRRKDRNAAEGLLASAVKESPEKAYEQLLFEVEDDVDVHRVVLAFRAWELLDVVGRGRAEAMLRQSVRFCLQTEEKGWGRGSREVRTLIPKLIEQYKLEHGAKPSKKADDAWVEKLANTVFGATPAAAAEAAAGALAEGFSPADVGEAIALAANQLVLRDSGRMKKQAQPNKPEGSVHGDGIGVHACDSIHAWRGISSVSTPRHQVASLILAAYHVARDRGYRADEFMNWTPYPRAEHWTKIGAEKDRAVLLKKLDGVIREKDQGAACAVVQRLHEIGCPATDVCAILRKFAISEDGALHAEKYYRTATQEFAAFRPAFKWRQLVALARVTASAYGFTAPGVAEAKQLLKDVTVG
jgi:hypothetical protein